MSELNVKLEDKNTAGKDRIEKVRPDEKLDWETPKMEDVSEQVMAQPYIRFT